MIPIHIIGIGLGKKDITPAQHALIQDCDLLVGGRRQLSLFSDLGKKSLSIAGDMDKLADQIRMAAQHSRIVVLASGDPLFHGIGATLRRYFSTAELIILPNISALAAAFAAIGEPWHDAALVSLHGREKQVDFRSLSRYNAVGFLTDAQKGPAFIADGFARAGITRAQIRVLENLGDPEGQSIRSYTDMDAVKADRHREPNVVIVTKIQAPAPSVSRETYSGMPDARFRHRKGLITKSEIRALSLSRLKLSRNNLIVWDIGAGSGSISVEAALILTGGQVTAFEKHPDRIDDIRFNAEQFGCSNIKIIHARFPEQAGDLTPPHRIFIGGSGPDPGAVLDFASQRLRPGGHLVMNTVLIRTLDRAVDLLEKKGFNTRINQIQVSRSRKMPDSIRFEALNPVWILSAAKPISKGEVND